MYFLLLRTLLHVAYQLRWGFDMSDELARTLTSLSLYRGDTMPTTTLSHSI